MNKPTHHITSDKTLMTIKEICIMWHAKYLWVDSVKYKLPEAWEKEYEMIDKWPFR